MPDDAQSIEADEVDPLLEALLADEDEEYEAETDEAEAQHSKDDKKLSVKELVAREVKTQTERLKQADKLYSGFMAEASDIERIVFDAPKDDDVTPAQMQKAIDAAKRKAQAISEKTSPEKVEEVIEMRVNEELAQRWGTGPVSTGSSKAADSFDNLRKKAREGDGHAAFLLFNAIPPSQS